MALDENNGKQSDSPEETDVFYTRPVSLCFSPTVVIRTGDQPSEKDRHPGLTLRQQALGIDRQAARCGRHFVVNDPRWRQAARSVYYRHKRWEVDQAGYASLPERNGLGLTIDKQKCARPGHDQIHVPLAESIRSRRFACRLLIPSFTKMLSDSSCSAGSDREPQMSHRVSWRKLKPRRTNKLLNSVNRCR